MVFAVRIFDCGRPEHTGLDRQHFLLNCPTPWLDDGTQHSVWLARQPL